MTEPSYSASTPSASLSTMDPYLQLLSPTSGNQNLNPSTVLAIVQKAISDPLVYTGFSQLRSLPAVAALESSACSNVTSKNKQLYSAILNTLDLFAHGTFNNYKNGVASGKYLELTDGQILKLRALTVVTLVQRSCIDINSADNISDIEIPRGRCRYKNKLLLRQMDGSINRSCISGSTSKTISGIGIVPYSLLQKELGLDDVKYTNRSTTSSTGNSLSGSETMHGVAIRPVEDILIHTMYSSLLPSSTKLDQRNMALIVSNISNAGLDGDADVGGMVRLVRDVRLSGDKIENGNEYEKDQGDLEEMIKKLESFYDRGLALKGFLENHGKSSSDSGTSFVLKDLQRWKEVDEITKRLQLKTKNLRGGGNSGCGGNIDVSNASEGSSLWGTMATIGGTVGGVAGMDMDSVGIGSESAGGPYSRRHVKRSRGGHSGGGETMGRFQM